MTKTLKLLICNTNIKYYLQLMRFDKPIGTMLLLWPTWIALWFAADGMPPIKELIVFTTGVIIMRAAGCTINDYADKDFDKLVKRTSQRPLTNKKISTIKALILFTILITTAFFLVLTLNRLTVLLSIVALILATIYPFTKRVTYFPQLFLGLAFGMSTIMAYAAVQNTIPSEAWLLYLGTICWIMAFDTQYALVDMEDDLKIGIKSTAIAFGAFFQLIISILQLAFLVILLLFGLLKNLNYVYYLSLFIGMLLFWHQNKLLKTGDPKSYFKAFMNNNAVGFSIFLGLIFGQR